MSFLRVFGRNPVNESKKTYPCPVDQTLEIHFTEPVVNVDISGVNLYIREKGTDTRIPITNLKTELLPGIYKLKLEHNHFDFNKQYEIIITDQIRDLDNETLSNPMTISFKTKKLNVDAELSFNDEHSSINDQVINEDKNRLYLLDRWNGLRVADITNPTQPKEAGRRDITPWGRGIGVTTKSGIALTDDKNTAVIAGSNTTISQSMMWLINVATDPKDTDAVAGYSILNNWYKQSTYVPIPLVYGGYTYESTGIGNYDKDDGVPFRVAVIGTEAYVTSLFIGIQVVDLTKVFGSPNTNPVTAIIDTKQNAGTIDALPRYIKAINKANGIKKLIVTTTEGLITINPDTIYRAEPTTISSQKICSSEVSCPTVHKDFFLQQSSSISNRRSNAVIEKGKGLIFLSLP